MIQVERIDENKYEVAFFKFTLTGVVIEEFIDQHRDLVKCVA